MPSERFFKLDDVKQNRIIDASIDEFLKNGYTDASINQIIKEADISRGSFYTYFTDKSELFGHIFDKMKHMAGDAVINTVKECDGDIFAAGRKLVRLGKVYKPVHGDKMTMLFCSLLSKKDIMKFISNLSSHKTQSDPELDHMVDVIYENLNDLREHISRENFTALIDMLATISIKALTAARSDNNDYSINLLFKQYDIIETGIRGGALK